MSLRIRGTQDFIDLTLFDFIVTQARRQLERHNFTEIATPVLEPTDLFKRSLGLATDIVNKEMFIIQSADDAGDICLRPEMTAPIVRAFLDNGIQQLPWKVFSIGACFRYERPQKGRFRQFHQVSIEVIGSDASLQDVALIALLDDLFTRVFKLQGYGLLINYLGTPEDRQAFKQVLTAYLETVLDRICETCRERKDKNILRVFDCKNADCQQAYVNAPVPTDHLSAASAAEWAAIQEQLQLLSVSYSHDPRLVRGLDYYGKTVFEFVSFNLGAQNAFCGGGRYNTLVSQLGGKQDQPSIGAAFGIERLMLMLEPLQSSLALPHKPALHVMVPLEPAQQPLALLLAQPLTDAGLCVDVILEGGSVKSMMRRANKMGATYCLIIGATEQAQGTVVVKNMVNGTEEVVRQAELVKRLV